MRQLEPNFQSRKNRHPGILFEYVPERAGFRRTQRETIILSIIKLRTRAVRKLNESMGMDENEGNDCPARDLAAAASRLPKPAENGAVVRKMSAQPARGRGKAEFASDLGWSGDDSYTAALFKE